jgi:hypothetical protein
MPSVLRAFELCNYIHTTKNQMCINNDEGSTQIMDAELLTRKKKQGPLHSASVEVRSGGNSSELPMYCQTS